MELCKDIILKAQSSLCRSSFYWSLGLHDLLLRFFAQSKLQYTRFLLIKTSQNTVLFKHILYHFKFDLFWILNLGVGRGDFAKNKIGLWISLFTVNFSLKDNFCNIYEKRYPLMLMYIYFSFISALNKVQL